MNRGQWLLIKFCILQSSMIEFLLKLFEFSFLIRVHLLNFLVALWANFCGRFIGRFINLDILFYIFFLVLFCRIDHSLFESLLTVSCLVFLSAVKPFHQSLYNLFVLFLLVFKILLYNKVFVSLKILFLIHQIFNITIDVDIFIHVIELIVSVTLLTWGKICLDLEIIWECLWVSIIFLALLFLFWFVLHFFICTLVLIILNIFNCLLLLFLLLFKSLLTAFLCEFF